MSAPTKDSASVLALAADLAASDLHAAGKPKTAEALVSAAREVLAQLDAALRDAKKVNRAMGVSLSEGETAEQERDALMTVGLELCAEVKARGLRLPAVRRFEAVVEVARKEQ